MSNANYNKTQYQGLIIASAYAWIAILSTFVGAQFTPLAWPIYPIYANILGIISAA